jgi:hypothetical protein
VRKHERRRRDERGRTGAGRALVCWTVDYQTQTMGSESLRRLGSPLGKNRSKKLCGRLNASRFVEPSLIDSSML